MGTAKTKKKPSKQSAYWRYLYQKRRRFFGIKPAQIAWGQILALAGAIFAGLHLESSKTTLALIVGTFVILPGIFDLVGSLGSALSAKIAHKLQDAREPIWKILFTSIGYAISTAVLAGLIVAGAGGAIAAHFFDANFEQVFQLAYGAIIISSLIGFPIVGIATTISCLMRINPDQIIVPLETSFYDVLTVVVMVAVVGWLA